MKFLSIIIPHYSESEKEIFPLLSSIYTQVGIDFSAIEVIIVTDGGGIDLNGEFFELFKPIEIRNLTINENDGPGLARQAGIDAAKGQYLMFCDADDVLHNVGALGAMMQEAEKTAPDILATSWLEELVNPDGTHAYVTHAHENTWMHGKLLRRQFLAQNGIRHHPELRVHEDSYLLSIATALTERTAYLDIISYVWKYHAESITRRNGASYSFDSIPTFIRACCESDKVVEQRRPDLMEYKICQFVLYNFFCLHQPQWLERAQDLDNAEKALTENLAPFWRYWDGAAPERRAEIYNQERQKHFAGCIESELISDWIARIRR